MDIRVSIFEDNKLVREALQTILQGTPGYTCAGAFAHGNQWEDDICFSQPDVVLMDIEMPGQNGIDLTRQICGRFPEIRVVIQTVFNDGDKIFQALCAGASGYILKNDPPLQLLDAILEACHGGAPMSAPVARKVLGFFTNRNVILVSPGDTDYNLTNREKELLKLMGEGLHYKAIAERTFISYETVRTHVKHIYKKLHVASRSEAIQKAIQNGLL